MIHDAAARIAGIGVLAIVCQWLGWRLKLPAIVFLPIAGMIAGPVTGWLQPDALFGDLRQGARVYQHQASVDVARLEADCNLRNVRQS